MDIEFGTEVFARDGKSLGNVDYIIRNAWTGEISKFRIRRDSLDSEIILSTDQIIDSAGTKIKVDVSAE